MAVREMAIELDRFCPADTISRPILVAFRARPQHIAICRFAPLDNMQKLSQAINFTHTMERINVFFAGNSMVLGHQEVH
jgi:hypothetical protein